MSARALLGCVIVAAVGAAALRFSADRRQVTGQAVPRSQGSAASPRDVGQSSSPPTDIAREGDRVPATKRAGFVAEQTDTRTDPHSRLASRSAAESRPAAGETLEVTFHVDGDPSVADALTIVVVSEANGQAVARADVTTTSTRIRLEPIPHFATLRDEAGATGPWVSFTPSESTPTVDLAAPSQFAATLTVLDDADQVPLVGAQVELERVDGPPDWMQGAIPTATVDDSGRVQFDPLSAGRYRVRADADGYAPDQGETDLRSSDGSPVDMGSLHLVRLREVLFRLVGAKHSLDHSGFEISHTHEGETFTFDAAGEATVVLGRHSEPLYVFLWEGTDQNRAIYLDGGIPPPGVAHEIAVGGSRRLDVDVQIAHGLREIVATADAWITCAYRSKNGDANQASMRFHGAGTYAFPETQAEKAVVTFMSVDPETANSEWCSEAVTLEDDATTSVTLLVDREPIELQVVERGQPVAGVWFELRLVPDDTTWTSSGLTGANGRTSIPRVRNGRLSLFLWSDEPNRMGIDIPFAVALGNDVTTVDVSDRAPTFVEISTPGGDPVEGVSVSFVGRDTHFAFERSTTDQSGRTTEYGLLRSSRADRVIHGDDIWVRRRRAALVPGRNPVTAHRLGSLEIAASIPVEQVIWREAQLAVPALAAGIEPGRAVSVPEGRYDWQVNGERRGSVTVRRGETARLFPFD